jgi:hypothetical protein
MTCGQSRNHCSKIERSNRKTYFGTLHCAHFWSFGADLKMDIRTFINFAIGALVAGIIIGGFEYHAPKKDCEYDRKRGR